MSFTDDFYMLFVSFTIKKKKQVLFHCFSESKTKHVMSSQSRIYGSRTKIDNKELKFNFISGFYNPLVFFNTDFFPNMII